MKTPEGIPQNSRESEEAVWKKDNPQQQAEAVEVDPAELTQKAQELFNISKEEEFEDFLKSFIAKFCENLEQTDLSQQAQQEQLAEIRELMTNEDSLFNLAVQIWNLRQKMINPDTEKTAKDEYGKFLKDNPILLLDDELGSNGFLMKLITAVTEHYEKAKRSLPQAV